MKKNAQGKDDGAKSPKKPKISYLCKPENMTLEEWQIALREQIAAKEVFGIEETDVKNLPGYYNVRSMSSRNDYRVVFRGKGNLLNYCSCMDFRTSRLGTCKHIEATRLWIEDKGKPVYTQIPCYTSLFLSYRQEREVRFCIGTDHAEEYQAIERKYCDRKGVMKKSAFPHIYEILGECAAIDSAFRWYDDALEYIEMHNNAARRNAINRSLTDEQLDALLTTRLYPFQREGIRFAFCKGRSIIADEMGLGKTIQAIGTAELLKAKKLISSVLIICPTSLKYQWKKEIERFTHSDAVVVEGNHLVRKRLYDEEAFYKIVSYNAACNDIQILGSLITDCLIMDEVQRLKNWNTKISKAARKIESEYAVILSGTPLENKLDELYGIMQFADQYCLGPYYQFKADTTITTESGKVVAYQNLNKVGQRLHEVMIRRRKRDVNLQLPPRSDKNLFVPMTPEQEGMHEDWQWKVSLIVNKWNRQHFLSEADRKRLLLLLSQMRMVCDSTYILDQKSRYDTKVEETMNILESIFASGDDKVVIFSQWERMTRLVAAELDSRGIRYEYLHGGVPSEKRKQLTDNFTENPSSRVFLSTDAGCTGLNLQVASYLINLDLPWNPAVLEQRIARIFRIGQQSHIQVINLVSQTSPGHGISIEERMLSTLSFKTSLSEGILDNGEDRICIDDSKLKKLMESLQDLGETETAKRAESVDSKTSDTAEVDGDDLFELRNESPADASTDSPLPEADSHTDSHAYSHADSPRELLQQGISFLGGLAKTLQSAESTQKLVDSIVSVDEKTGQAALHIPVADKETVANILGLFGKLMGGSTK